MNQDRSIDAVKEIMLHFARTTGLTESKKAPRRYLWTDAFAVCNFLELYRQTQDENWRELALRLVDKVHQVLGRHRTDSSRTGWISGLSEEEGKLHPTRGGLRIGKPLNERQPDDFADERLEWDRDGQYYHYLTKWMHALHRVSRVTGNVTYLGWAMELAKAAHQSFSYDSPEGGRRLYWKMSIDLSRPLAKSMGQHDPLDGLVTYSELRAAARALGGSSFPSLDEEIAELHEMCREREWATDDTLGIGGLLSDGLRIAQLMVEGEFEGTEYLQEVLEAARIGLAAVTQENELVLSGRFRMAFRELGLSIGLQAVQALPALLEQNTAPFGDNVRALRDRLQVISQYLPLKQEIEAFWLDPVNEETATWQDHREINMVMLATSLAPGEFLSAANS
jgi:hypothetical protein